MLYEVSATRRAKNIDIKRIIKTFNIFDTLSEVILLFHDISTYFGLKFFSKLLGKQLTSRKHKIAKPTVWITRGRCENAFTTVSSIRPISKISGNRTVGIIKMRAVAARRRNCNLNIQTEAKTAFTKCFQVKETAYIEVVKENLLVYSNNIRKRERRQVHHSNNLRRDEKGSGTSQFVYP